MLNLVCTRAVRLAVALVVVVLVFSLIVRGAMHLTGRDVMLGLVPFLDVNREANLPTFVSVCLLLTIAALLALVSELGGGTTTKALKTRWRVLAVGFGLMALDEFASLHERLTAPMRWVLADTPLVALHYAWVPVGVTFVAVIGLYFLPFLRALPGDIRSGFVTAGATYLGGALVMESIGGMLASSTGEMTWEYTLISTFEEALEFGGLLVFFQTILVHLRRISPHISVRVQ